MLLNSNGKYGFVLFETKQYQAASEILEKALKENEDSEIINAKLALTYQQLDDSEKALKYFKQTFLLNPKLVSLKCKILAVSDSTKFDSGNIPKATPNGENFILRACMKGKIEIENGIVSMQSRYYKPNM